MKKLDSNYEAKLYKKLSENRVQCELCPRRCVIAEGNTGFCKVRRNINGTLYAISYGRAVRAAEEFIETEAVFHFEPGSRILSLGNVGCNLNCSYCQNWRFSQIEHIDEKSIIKYTPEEVVKMALERDIKILSWTYNDPVIWYEFVLDTARLAKKHGLYNLFKSALFVNPEAIEELMKVIDIFSISIKSLNDEFYRKLTTGWIKPVLQGTKKIFDSGKHYLEISNLVVTGANDKEKDYLELIDWVKNNLSVDVPLHFVRFHPNYKYTHVSRPLIDTLEKARELAKDSGIKHCYLGNVFSHEGANTYCRVCNNLLVERMGLNATPAGIEANCRGYVCKKCNADAEIGIFKKKEENHGKIKV